MKVLRLVSQEGWKICVQGGKDAASARYIFTQLSKLARLVFPVYDDPLLKYQEDDGQSIEPVW